MKPKAPVATELADTLTVIRSVPAARTDPDVNDADAVCPASLYVIVMVPGVGSVVPVVEMVKACALELMFTTQYHAFAAPLAGTLG